MMDLYGKVYNVLQYCKILCCNIVCNILMFQQYFSNISAIFCVVGADILKNA